MSVWKRACFCVIRKCAMSILVFAIILVVMLAVSTVAATNRTLEAVRTGQSELNTEMNIEVFDNEEMRAWEETTKEEAAKELVQKMEKLLLMLTFGILFVGFSILALVMAFRTQNRIREFGILIATGISKWEIVLQNFIEIGMIVLAVFLATAFLARPIAGFFVPLITDGALNTVQVLSQTCSLWDSIFMYGLGTGVILLSTFVSCVQIMVASPRTLLSKIS